jgi:5'-methylthioadenosine phosphorylase
LGQALQAQTSGRRHEIDTPFGRPSDGIVESEWAGVPVYFLSRHGPGHTLNPSQIPARANIFALKELGCTHIIASGAVGSLREEFRPRDLVIPDQLIDKTSRRIGTFYDSAAVHVEFSEPFCPVLRQILLEAGRTALLQQPPPAAAPWQVHGRGCYVCMEGPAFSTRAESLMHRLWGGDLIGMTAMPEAKLAREAEISYALIALVTDYDCWRSHAPGQTAKEGGEPPGKLELLKEIIGNLQTATENAIRVIRRAVQIIAERQKELPASPAQSALELAIWSDKARIPQAEVQRLRPLWIKYFGAAPHNTAAESSTG